MKIIDRFKKAIRTFCIFYADSTELLEKAEKMLRPLPDGCTLLKLTSENKDSYKCRWAVGKVFESNRGAGQILAVVNENNEIIAYHYGICRGNGSMFFRVRNCDYEHTLVVVDERYRRKGIALFLIYQAVKEYPDKKIGTMIRPDNVASLMLHESIGFKKSHTVRLFHMTRVCHNRFVYFNLPYYSI